MTLFLIASRLVNRAKRDHVILLVLLAVAVTLVGAWLFSLTQHVSFGIGVYWAITTATTVGYGDVVPHNTVGRVIASALMLTVIPLVGAVFALVAGVTVLSRIRRLLGMDTHLPDGEYTVIIGDHPVVSRVSVELDESGDGVVVVSSARPAGVPHGVAHVAGDPGDEDTLRKAGLGGANRALIACSDDAQALIAAIAVHTLAPDLEVYALSESPRVARALEELGVHHTISSTELLGHTVAKSLETPLAGDLLLSLVDTDDYVLQERAVDAGLLGRRLHEARALADGLVLGMARNGTFDIGLGDNPILGEGDRLLVLAPRLDHRAAPAPAGATSPTPAT